MVFFVTSYYYYIFAQMKLLRNILILLALLFGVYTLVMYYATEESQSFTIEKEISFPLDKVYPQFNNLQNFARWNQYFSTENNKDLRISYFLPYEGEGSSMSFRKGNSQTAGELYIRYENPSKGLKYQLFEPDEHHPFVINVKFIPQSESKTKIIWNVNTPKIPVLERYKNIWSEDTFVQNIDKSMAFLTNILSNKVDREVQLNQIKYDSIMVENMENTILLGVHSNSQNKQDVLYTNIIRDYNKVNNFAMVDLGKREDEIGYPVLIASNDQLKSKSVSYFIGVSLSKKVNLTDNNFTYRDKNASLLYSIYYKGKFQNRMSSIQKLIQKAQKDTLNYGEVMQTFLQSPEEGKEVMMKFSLPVHK